MKKEAKTAARTPKGPPGQAARILAANLRAIIEHEKSNPSAWAASHKTDKKTVQRAYKAETSPTLDNVQRLADAAGLQPWQLLFPGLDPTNPPVAVGKSEFEMYAKIQRAFERLPPLTNVSA